MTAIQEKIARKIEQDGPICFGEFMAEALYCPNLGYYEVGTNNIGASGDFYTSVSTGALFGSLLAFQIREWQANLKDRHVSRRTFRIVEAGAHDGRLAKDILSWFEKHSPEVLEEIEYWIVEPSESRRGIQEATLSGVAGRVRWARSIVELQGVCGVIISNELLDALPVHAVAWDADAKQWLERRVGLIDGRFGWVTGPACGSVTADGRLSAVLEGSTGVLPNGFCTEIHLDAERWWKEAAGALEAGWLLTFDYGLCREEFFLAHRAGGTLRGYSKHRHAADVLANPGSQDITSHVNFTGIEEAGIGAGLRTRYFGTQASFLVSVAERYWKSGLPPWTSKEVQQFKMLTHPDGFGRAFKALLQER